MNHNNMYAPRLMIILCSISWIYSGGATVSIAIAIATKQFVLCHFPIQTFVVHCKYNVVRSRGTVDDFHDDTATTATTTTVGGQQV